jgi:hypothetical protein
MGMGRVRYGCRLQISYLSEILTYRAGWCGLAWVFFLLTSTTTAFGFLPCKIILLQTLTGPSLTANPMLHVDYYIESHSLCIVWHCNLLPCHLTILLEYLNFSSIDTYFANSLPFTLLHLVQGCARSSKYHAIFLMPCRCLLVVNNSLTCFQSPRPCIPPCSTNHKCPGSAFPNPNPHHVLTVLSVIFPSHQ